MLWADKTAEAMPAAAVGEVISMVVSAIVGMLSYPTKVDEGLREATPSHRELRPIISCELV
jgi:hypothetical protein